MKSLSTILCFLLLFCPLLLLHSSANAQGLTTASMNGIVTDKAGKPLPGTNVVATHLPTGSIFGTSTRDDGRFNIPGMKVGGPYTVKASILGYATTTRGGINLALGQDLRIDFSLSEEAVQLGEVEAIGERNAVISASRTGASLNVSREQIERLPTIARSFQDFQRLVPQFVSFPQGSSSPALGSAAGRNFRFNNIQIDGAQINNLFGLAGAGGVPGGNAGTQPISLDALQEFQVVVAPYDVRQAGFTGGGVNAITRSGTNNFSGSAYLFYKDQSFVGKGFDAARSPYPRFNDRSIGVRLGGPLLEDKAFFFVSGEIARRNAPYDVVLTGAGTSTNISPIPADSARKFANILRTKYGYDPGSFDPFVKQTQSNKAFVRLDFNVGENHKVTLRHNYVDANDDNLVRTLPRVDFSNTDYVFSSKTTSAAAQLTSTFSNKASNEVILGYTAIRDKRTNPYGSAFPLVQVTGLGGSGTLTAGTENFSVANSLDQDIFEITDNFTYYSGNYVFTFGTHNEIFNFANLFIRDYYGNYTFNNLTDLINGKAARYQYSYSVTGNPHQMAKFKAIQYGLYGQVEASVLSNVKLTVGIRVDVPTLPDKPAYNPTIASTFASYGLSTDVVPSGNMLFSPRVGVNWDVMGDRSTQIRGGVGMFTGRIPYVWISNQYGNTGVEFGRVDARSLPAGFFSPSITSPPRPGITPGLSPVATTEVDVTDKDFKMPQLLRADLAFDRQLPFGIVGTLEGIYSKTMNDAFYQDINIAAPTSVLAGPDSRHVYGTYSGRNTTSTPVNKAFTNVIYLRNTSEGYQYSLTAQLQRQLSDGLFGVAAYTYGKAKDRNSVTSDQAISQWRFVPTPDSPNEPPVATSNFDIPHRVLAAVSYRREWVEGWGTTLTLFYNGQSGRPFSYVYDGDVNADGQVENDLVYVPRNASEVKLVRVSGSTITTAPGSDYDALFKYISNDKYLTSYQGSVVQRNGGREPWWGEVDLRVVQDIPVMASHTFQLTLDILNITNMINKDWGKQKYVNLQRDFLLRFEGLDSSTKQPMFSYNASKPDPYALDQLLSRWQMQMGIRYSF